MVVIMGGRAVYTDIIHDRQTAQLQSARRCATEGRNLRVDAEVGIISSWSTRTWPRRTISLLCRLNQNRPVPLRHNHRPTSLAVLPRLRTADHLESILHLLILIIQLCNLSERREHPPGRALVAHGTRSINRNESRRLCCPSRTLRAAEKSTETEQTESGFETGQASADQADICFYNGPQEHVFHLVRVIFAREVYTHENCETQTGNNGDEAAEEKDPAEHETLADRSVESPDVGEWDHEEDDVGYDVGDGGAL